MYKIPEGLPDNLKQELQKLIDNPDKYRKLYPVAYKSLIKYLIKEPSNEKNKK